MATSTASPSSLTARRTTIAMKLVMAVTGAFFVFYVLAHMYGNLKAFAGAESFNGYSHHLRVLGDPILPDGGFLWIMRLLLVGALVAHVYSAFYLWSRAQGARTTKYAVKKAAATTLSARFMRWGGVTLLLFIVFHLLQFTSNTIRVNGDYDNPFQRLVAGFQVWWVVVIYLLALAALAMHLRHGVWSASQTLGWTSSARSRRIANQAAITIAAVVSIGFALVPISVLVGIVK
ncbi:MAG: succinate dehydrogenase cytochrome b subunit [Actinomycetota bacterium]|nr:succinate dehydrogenase cytochrome b subunit [Actinomycetota bacterium]